MALTEWLFLLAPWAPALLWAWLIWCRGGFWWADQFLADDARAADPWPAILAIVPARNEAETVLAALGSLLAQDYPGTLSVVLVDDASEDGTAELARRAFAGEARLHIVRTGTLPAGWTGKMWAVERGLAEIGRVLPEARFVLLTDADIEHDPANLTRLVAKAEDEALGLVSLMVRLKAETPWEKLLIPAFVFFFQKLYPFPWVNDPARRMAAAAGGCMLVRRSVLEAVGGMQPIRDAVIDDCALARAIKARAPIWLGLTQETRSLRGYAALSGIWRMVARTAFVQLRFSALALAGTVIGMAVLYLAAPALAAAGALAGDGVLLAAGGAAWTLMAIAYRPTLKLYGQGLARAWLLPLAAFLYTLMTVDSARRHWTGNAPLWKGRPNRVAADLTQTPLDSRQG